MPDLIAKLHQIQCPLWLRPRTHCRVSSQRSPDYLDGYEWHGRGKGRENGKEGMRKGRMMERRETVLKYPHFLTF